jgi:hypothetical protein
MTRATSALGGNEIAGAVVDDVANGDVLPRTHTVRGCYSVRDTLGLGLAREACVGVVRFGDRTRSSRSRHCPFPATAVCTRNCVCVYNDARHKDDPATELDAHLDWIGERLDRPNYRGCPQLNVAAAFPNSDHPARSVAAAHRRELRTPPRENRRTTTHKRNPGLLLSASAQATAGFPPVARADSAPKSAATRAQKVLQTNIFRRRRPRLTGHVSGWCVVV